MKQSWNCPDKISLRHPPSRWSSRSLAFTTDAEHGIRVPVTEIALADSPGGAANAPFRVYRTAGPGSDPVRGLEPFPGPLD